MQIYITNETLKFFISMIHGKVINNIINANTQIQIHKNKNTNTQIQFELNLQISLTCAFKEPLDRQIIKESKSKISKGQFS